MARAQRHEFPGTFTVLAQSCANGTAHPASSGTTVQAPSSATHGADCAECPVMVKISPGSFQMGSAGNEAGSNSNESPMHEVSIRYAFEVSRYPVTRGEWKRYLTDTHRSGSSNCYGYDQSTRSTGHDPRYSWNNPGFVQEDSHPVVCVTWDEVQEYIVWLNRRTAGHYRLLSEAEYEFVQRAGSRTTWPWGRTGDAQCSQANGADATLKHGAGQTSWIYAPCSDGFEFTSPVDHFPANPWGLHDISGNVKSWVADCWHDGYDGAPTNGSVWQGGDCTHHVNRGGDWDDEPGWMHSAQRSSDDDADSYVGFRLARTLQ
jgi:formylglycine-generating enzyme required for sulfatase activity